MKENKYDDPVFFERYGQMSRSVQGLEGAGEWPALREMMPELTGTDVLDLGCGYGWHCRYAIEKGAHTVTGVDLSQKMLEKAREINDLPGITYVRSSVEDFTAEENSFDIVISSLTFHYISSFGNICEMVYKLLRPGGKFIFSVEHPVFTAQGSQQWVLDDKGSPDHWPVDRYFEEGPRQAVFLGTEVTKYHRTLTTYINDLFRNGFRITGLREPAPSEEMVRTIEGMEDELRRPMMMLISAVKD